MTVIIVAIVALAVLIGFGFIKKGEVAPAEVVQPKNGDILEPQPEMVDISKPVDGFGIGLVNIPKGTVKWNANFAENAFSYDPIADSGWIGVDQVWTYFEDPKDVMTLRIWMLDANNNVVVDEQNLGPVRNQTNYVFDCETRILIAHTGGPSE